MAGHATVTSSLAGQFRYLVLAVWVLACAVLGWVGVTDQDLLWRIFCGFFSVLWSGLLLVFINQESALAWNHVVAKAEVLSYSRRAGRRGAPWVQYSFMAMDGQHYEASSNLFSRRGFQVGEQVSVLYNPLLPRKNKPLGGFVFYHFDVPEASS